MPVIPIVIGAHGKIIKDLVKGRENLEMVGQEETIQTITLTLARMLRRVLETPVKVHQLLPV